jgi:2',3'-cyclic-nucleotide 2'-phosphodiesterase (5'-nucleotidase family)
VLPEEMSKRHPESPLGNWVSDVIMTRLRKDGYDVDFAVVNYGGLRIPYLTAGPLTRGKIYELTPFDNTLMIVDIPGSKLDSFFMMMAESEGWPISKEAKLVISNKKMVSAHINNAPIDPNKIYKVATLDYVANGGDNMKVLIPLSRVQTGLILRDVLIEQAIATTAAGQTITAKNDGRVIIQ